LQLQPELTAPTELSVALPDGVVARGREDSRTFKPPEENQSHPAAASDPV
jgi:hypothetical protein